MRTLEELFVREYKSAIVMHGNKDIYKIPLPKVVESWGISGTDEYKVMGIETECFDILNDSVVRRVPPSFKVQRRVIDKVTRSYKQNADGSYIYQPYKMPPNSVAVYSVKNIKLPYKRYIANNEDCGYVDFFEKDDAVYFIYALPRTVLYKINQTALAISVKNMKNYQGMGYTTWEKGVLYIHVIPYSPNAKYTGSRILKTGRKTDYSRDIRLISDYWESVGLIPNISLSALQSGENLSLKPTIVGYETYNPIEPNPLGDKDIFGSEEGSNDEGEGKKRT